jgi:flagellar biosynthetic protein FlhB
MKLIIVGYIMYWTLKSDQQKIFELADMEIKPAIKLIVDETFKMAYRASIFLLGLAILDYAYQRWEYERSLKMTRQELKEELKSSEGDPIFQT